MTTTLFDAFVAGFNLSSEGYNAEYPYGVGSDEERKIKDLRQMYKEWYEEWMKATTKTKRSSYYAGGSMRESAD